jgi:hypothetical protein
MKRLVKRAAIMQVVTAVLSVGAVVASLLLLSGCGASLDTKYRARIGLCVDEAQTLAESKACRARVDSEFGVVDGGVR